MRAWAVILCLGHTSLILLLISQEAVAKRYDPSMVDPLSRRSTLDKNFMRFGRSSPSFTEEDETKDSGDSLSVTGTNKEDNFLRSMRGKDNFIRFGRARNDNFMRFGRGKENNFMRFGKSLEENVMRDTRGKQDSYMRFGRGKSDNYMRFGRGKQDNFMRFGRSRQDNFMRFGRGKQDSYMRFGRGKQDSYMRFGRGKQDSYMRFGRGKQDSYMRFGRYYEIVPGFQPFLSDRYEIAQNDGLKDLNSKQDDSMNFSSNPEDDVAINIPIAMRSSDSNFMRFGRARQDNFMRFGKSEGKNNLIATNEDTVERKELGPDKPDYSASSTSFTRDEKSKDTNLIRFGRHPLNKDDSFMRFGRNSQETVSESELIPPRLKRSIYDSADEFSPSKQQVEEYNTVFVPFSRLPDDLEEEYSPHEQQEDYMSRKKRSISNVSSTTPPLLDSSEDFISEQLTSKPVYESSLLSAGLPNVIVGPEFSLLPDLDPPSNMLKRGPGDKSFLRLG